MIDPTFQGVKILFVLLFENSTDKTVHTGCYLSQIVIKDYKVMIDGRNVFDQSVKNYVGAFKKKIGKGI